MGASGVVGRWDVWRAALAELISQQQAGAGVRRRFGGRCNAFGGAPHTLHAAGLSPLIPGENDIDQLGRTIGLLGSFERHWPEVSLLPRRACAC